MAVSKTIISQYIYPYSAVLIVFFFMNRLGWYEVIGKEGIRFFSPVTTLAVQSFVRLEVVTRYLLVPWKQASELRAVRLQYLSLLSTQEETEQLKKENESLRKILALPERQRDGRLLASIHSYTFPSVASGSKEGVTVGMSVLSEAILVGTVSEVKEHTATIQLLSQRARDESILVQTEAGVLGLLVAKTGSLYLEQIPLNASISEGERVSTLGQEGIAPNKVIGTIAKILRDEHKGTQRAEILQPSTFYSSAVVYLE